MDEAQQRLIATQKEEIAILRDVVEKKELEIKKNLGEYHQSFLKMAHFASQPCCSGCCSKNQEKAAGKKRQKK